jgi:hypothetical protein
MKLGSAVMRDGNDDFGGMVVSKNNYREDYLALKIEI